MIYGITDNGDRIFAAKKTKAACPHCKTNLVAKCGEIKVHHWAHKEAKDCPYAHGMTQWHYDWLISFDKRSSEGWEVEYFFDSIRFDAYNPAKKQAIEFQRIIDLDYITHKIEICQNAGIKLLWLISPKIFYNFVYANSTTDDKHHTLFSYRRGKRKISMLLENHLDNEHIMFLIDFQKKDCLPKYSTPSLDSGYYRIHDQDSEIRKHPMKSGIYIIHKMPSLKGYQYYDKCVLFIRYHKPNK